MSHHHCCDRDDEHCHHGHGSCGNASCSCCGGGHHEDHHGHEDFAHELLELADEAWMELLKEKIKEQIESTSGKHLSELAKIISDTNHERWKRKMSKKKSCSDFKEQLCQFFTHKST